MKIAAVIVTYNRLELLKECINAVRNQTRTLDEIIVINNSSTDGTLEWLNEQSDLTVITQENTGSAGGQYTGIKTAYEKGYDWIWCMDDDTIPESTALYNLENKIYNEKIGFICSTVKWIDGECSKINVASLLNLEKWLHNVAIKKVIPVKSCSFVSVLISRESVEKCGLPIKTFHIWLDDVEYTRRIFDSGFICYISIDSYVIHKTKENADPSLKSLNKTTKNKFYRSYRNWPTTLKSRSKNNNINYLLRVFELLFNTIIQIIKYNKYLYVPGLFTNFVIGMIKIQKIEYVEK